MSSVCLRLRLLKEAEESFEQKAKVKRLELWETQSCLPISDAITVMLCQAASSLSSIWLVVISPVWASMAKLVSPRLVWLMEYLWTKEEKESKMRRIFIVHITILYNSLCVVQWALESLYTWKLRTTKAVVSLIKANTCLQNNNCQTALRNWNYSP